jgi:hypothetical protein
MQSESRPLTWRAASKHSLLRWPTIVSFAGLIVAAINRLPNLACIFGCLLFATLPVWYFVTNRVFHGQPKPTATRQMLVCLALLVLALLLSPTFSVTHRFLDAEHDVTVTWTKRSLFDTIREPFYSQDELVWGQSNYDVRYVPSTVFCPEFSTRSYPLFTVERDENLRSVLVRSVGDGTRMDAPPPPDTLQRFLSRCATEGQAMLNSSLTKESALMQGNVDLFFSRAEQEHSDANGEVVLEDAQIPPHIMKKVETFLANDPDRGFWYVNFNLPDVEPVARGAKPTAPGQLQPDVVRRLKTIAIAAALGRNEELARLKAK